MNRSKYMPVMNPCEELEDNKFLCADDNIPQYKNETCIEQIMLMKNNYSECRQYSIQIEELKIQKIYSSKWMLFSKNTQIITEHCRDETHKYSIKGTYFFTPSEDCDIQVADVYINKPTNASDVSLLQSTIVQIPELQQKIRREARELDLRNVDFTDIKEILKSAKLTTDGSGTYNDMFIVTDKASLWTVLLYILLIIIIATFLVFKFKKHCCKRNSPKMPAASTDNFSPGEGGVKDGRPIQLSFISTSSHQRQA